MSIFQRYLRKANRTVHRFQYRLGKRFDSNVYFVVPGVNWAVDWVGHYVKKWIEAEFDLKVDLIEDPSKLVGQIIHYGSLWSYVANVDVRHNRYNKVVATIFHGDPDDERFNFKKRIDLFLQKQGGLERIVVSNRIMERRLVDWGVPEAKIVLLPIGIDLDMFDPALAKGREAARKEYGIPDSAFCIGSFHKDGKGWEEGFEPKIVKGPDIFLKTLEELQKVRPDLFVLLSAPARGYVKKGLTALGIPFRHTVFDEYREVVDLYPALDAYLITSREEGGPKGLMEAFAMGVPVVSTRVGMVPDVAAHGQNALVAESEDYLALSRHLATLAGDRELGKRLVADAFEAVKLYDWKPIARQYYQKLYRPLIE